MQTTTAKDFYGGGLSVRGGSTSARPFMKCGQDFWRHKEESRRCQRVPENSVKRSQVREKGRADTKGKPANVYWGTRESK